MKYNKPNVLSKNLLLKDDTLTVSSFDSPLFMNPITKQSIPSFVKLEKEVIENEDSKIGDSLPKGAGNHVSIGVSKLFDKAESKQKAKNDNEPSLNTKSLDGKCLLPNKSNSSQTSKPRATSAFRKKNKDISSDDTSESESESNSQNSSESEEEKHGKIEINQLVVSDSDSDSDFGNLPPPIPQKVSFGKWISQAPKSEGPLMQFNMFEGKSKEKSDKNIDKLLDKSYRKQITTPMFHRRKVLVTNTSGIAPSLGSKYGFSSLNQDEKTEKRSPTNNENLNDAIKIKKEKMHPLPMNILNKHASWQMTPSETNDNSKKLLQMKTIGTANPITDKRIKDESDIKTKLNYVTQLKEDPRGLKQWSNSFSEAINEVKIENKEYLDNIDPKVQHVFKKLSTLKKKTVVFGLDGVLVKTSFEKDSAEWKGSELVLDEKKNQKMKIYVAIRPYVINTLKQLKRAGIELVLYSSSQFNYTTAILNVLFKHKVEFHHIIWAEEHEKATKPADENRPIRKINTKNINLLLDNRNIKDIIIVDCKVQGFAYNIQNGVFIPPFEGPPNDANPIPDNFFMYLFEYLKSFSDLNDVRTKIKREFDIK